MVIVLDINNNSDILFGKQGFALRKVVGHPKSLNPWNLGYLAYVFGAKTNISLFVQRQK